MKNYSTINQQTELHILGTGLTFNQPKCKIGQKKQKLFIVEIAWLKYLLN